MPIVTALPRGQSNGQVITEFIDSVGTTSVTYTYPKTQELLVIRNTGTKSITVTVNSTSQTIQPENKWEIELDFVAFAIVSTNGVQSFEAWADEKGFSFGTPEGKYINSNENLTALKNENVYFQKVSDTQFYVWLKPDGSKWLRYDFLKDVNVPINLNAWRIDRLHAIDIPAYSPLTKPTPTTTTTLTALGAQWEYAIKPFGAPDLFGGYHGDEQTQTIAITADGDTVDFATLAAGAVFGCVRLEFKHTSKGYNPTDGTTVIADIECRYIFTSGGLQLKPKMTWALATTVATSYVGMLPALRGPGLTTHSKFIDDTAINDISTALHPQTGKNTYGVELFNYTNGLRMRIEFDDMDWFNGYTLSSNKGMWAANAAQYNKVYPTRILNSVSQESVSIGTVWKASLRYKVTFPEK